MWVADMRLKFLTLLMLVVLFISLIITALRFGFGVLEDNFVAQLSTHYNSSAQFMSFYGLLNFYVYAMAYVYAPGNKSLQGKSITVKCQRMVYELTARRRYIILCQTFSENFIMIYLKENRIFFMLLLTHHF